MVENARDAGVILECLWATVSGPFFEDWEFETLMGFGRDEIRRIAESWPTAEDDRAQRIAVNNALNNLLSYPHNRWDVWHDYISSTPTEIAGVYERFLRNAKTDRYFDRLM
ncbi:hypothetical protein FZI91_09845 [Mycobacterium sp. CBMA271]|uniref:hypothetical protein n=1 Tax=unclassified Mycobacteroides TaxID=2618759 RepID=UPI0012DC276C|nr:MULTISPECIES: hypothetical protein [unclassified Mycobacteroides]MUM22003.1 hypothetical protein [Mycobacteroides sp. CBMA 271]